MLTQFTDYTMLWPWNEVQHWLLWLTSTDHLWYELLTKTEPWHWLKSEIYLELILFTNISIVEILATTYTLILSTHEMLSLLWDKTLWDITSNVLTCNRLNIKFRHWLCLNIGYSLKPNAELRINSNHEHKLKLHLM